MSIPTAGELRTMDSRKCYAFTKYMDCLIGEILIEYDYIYILHNNSKVNGYKKPENMRGYKYSWCLAYEKQDDYISTAIISLFFLEERALSNKNIDTETKQHNDKIKLISEIIKFMRKNGYFVGKLGSHKEMKEFLISIL